MDRILRRIGNISAMLYPKKDDVYSGNSHVAYNDRTEPV